MRHFVTDLSRAGHSPWGQIVPIWLKQNILCQASQEPPHLHINLERTKRGLGPGWPWSSHSAPELGSCPLLRQEAWTSECPIFQKSRGIQFWQLSKFPNTPPNLAT